MFFVNGEKRRLLSHLQSSQFTTKKFVHFLLPVLLLGLESEYGRLKMAEVYGRLKMAEESMLPV
jgi:hypothetical protein